MRRYLPCAVANPGSEREGNGRPSACGSFAFYYDRYLVEADGHVQLEKLEPRYDDLR